MADVSNEPAKPASRKPGEVPLSKPITAHGETLAKLTLREPGGKDFRVIGIPYRIAQDGSTIIDGRIIAQFISELAGIPLSVVDKLPPGDWQNAMAAVLDFFGKGPAAS